MIIIPDVHGRTFWKDSVNDSDQIVFLGDYLDPYPGEGIKLEDTLENFKKIIEYKKSNPSRVILLLGNHDFMYIHDKHIRMACRHDFTNEPQITSLFYDNRDLFQMSYKIDYNNKTVVFSHAGIMPEWIENHKDIFGENSGIKEVSDISNKLYSDSNEKFIRSLLDYSLFRGGIKAFGSMIWSDVRERFEYLLEPENEVFQIFGHTQLKDKPLKYPNFACIDCRRSFTLDEILC